jgi:hypothetical protein
MIGKGKPGWEEMLPEGIATLIKKHKLFDYDPRRELEENTN